MIVGPLHPGAMGASLAATCAADTAWVADGRSDATRRRADALRMRPVATLAALSATADVIVSVCPPGSAAPLASWMQLPSRTRASLRSRTNRHRR